MITISEDRIIRVKKGEELEGKKIVCNFDYDVIDKGDIGTIEYTKSRGLWYEVAVCNFNDTILELRILRE